MADEIVLEAASTVGDVVAEAASTADEVATEAVSTVDEVGAEAASATDELAAKAVSTTDEVVPRPHLRRMRSQPRLRPRRTSTKFSALPASLIVWLDQHGLDHSPLPFVVQCLILPLLTLTFFIMRTKQKQSGFKRLF